MKLIEISQEGSEGGHPRDTVIRRDLTPDQIADLLHNECAISYKQFLTGSYLFRRIHTGSGTFLADSTRHLRKSANTHNYYTLLMDNLSSWDNYPKRSKSFICSVINNPRSGTGFVVLPFDNPKVGFRSLVIDA